MCLQNSFFLYTSEIFIYNISFDTKQTLRDVTLTNGLKDQFALQCLKGGIIVTL